MECKYHYIFSIKQICFEITEYLDSNTLISLNKSNVFQYINHKHLFRLYLNEWSSRNQLYEFTEDFVQHKQNIK